MGAWPGPDTSPLRARSQKLEDEADVSAVCRKRRIVSVVPHFYRRHGVLDLLLCRRSPPTRRLANSELLGNADLYILPAAAGLRNVARLEVRSADRSLLRREHHLPYGLLGSARADVVLLHHQGASPKSQCAQTRSLEHQTLLCGKAITVGAGHERSECKPDRAQPSSNDRARFLIPQDLMPWIVRGHRPCLQ